MRSYKMTIFYRKVTVFILLLLLSLSLRSPALVHAESDSSNKEREIKFDQKIEESEKGEEKFFYRIISTLRGDGHFVVLSYFGKKTNDDGSCSIYFLSFVFSEKSFNGTWKMNPRAGVGEEKPITVNFYKGIYYYKSIDISVYCPKERTYSYSGFPNLRMSSPDSFPTAEEIIDSGTLDLTRDSYRDPDPDTDGTLSNSIPTPKIHVNKDYSFGFDNCTDDYYIQLQGRFWSVDDIELYKENMMWKYRYSSYIKGGLNDWYTAGSKTKANSGNLSFLENGRAYFDDLLTLHPINDRNFYGGTNAVGNYFSGYNNALDTIKMLLGQPTSGYNGVEVYVRYFTYTDTGELIYGKWCHYYDDLAKSGSSGSDWDDDDTLHNGQQSENGLTDNEKEENEKKDDSRKGDHDVNIYTPDDDYTGNGVAFTGVIELLNSLKSQSGAFLSLFSEIFSFLPSWLVSLIYASIGVCCFLGIWHFVRG